MSRTADAHQKQIAPFTHFGRSYSTKVAVVTTGSSQNTSPVSTISTMPGNNTVYHANDVIEFSCCLFRNSRSRRFLISHTDYDLLITH